MRIFKAHKWALLISLQVLSSLVFRSVRNNLPAFGRFHVMKLVVVMVVVSVFRRSSLELMHFSNVSAGRDPPAVLLKHKWTHHSPCAGALIRSGKLFSQFALICVPYFPAALYSAQSDGCISYHSAFGYPLDSCETL